jgi:hypothetical protein
MVPERCCAVTVIDAYGRRPKIGQFAATIPTWYST